MSRRLSFWAALTTAAMILAASAPSQATTKSQCTVDKVAWFDTGYMSGTRGGVLVNCVGDATNFYSFGSHPYCGSYTIEVLKGLFSVAQAALLSGKKVDIEYTQLGYPCSQAVFGSIKLLR